MLRALALVSLLFASLSVSAQTPPQCFGGRAVASVPLTLGARLSLDDTCEYSRRPEGPYRRVQGIDKIVDLLSELGWGTGDSTTVYARKRSDPDTLTSVFVDHCTDYMLAPGGAFAVTPGAERGELELSRRSARCGASVLSLQLECSVRNGPPAATLSAAQSRVVLPACTAGWQVAARPAGGRPYSLGRLRAGGETPLQAFFANRDSRALMTPSFEQGLRFTPQDDDALWEELRAAFASGAARIVRKQGAAASATACTEGEPVEVEVRGDGIAIADEVWADELRSELGDLRGVVDLARIKELAGELHVCLASSYGVRQVGGAVLGLPFRQLAQTEAIGQTFANAEICVGHKTLRVTPNGLEPQDGERECAPATETPLFIAAHGSTIELPEGAIACSGRDPLEGEGRVFALRRGFVDVRVDSHQGCRSLQTASLARVGVIDPGRDWIPLGLARASRGTSAEDVGAWQGLLIDDPRTFARSRRDGDLRFRINTPEGFAAAWNHPARGAATLVSRFAPNVGDEEGAFGSARPPALSTRVTDSAECVFDELVSADDVLVDERVYVHLVANDGDTQRCLASAAFRTWEPRVLTNVGRSERRQLRLGVIGDARLGVFFSKPEPGAIGALLPIVYMDVHLKAGFLFEVSMPVTGAIAWENGAGSRVSVALMAAMNWGVPEIAPRLITTGFLIHAPWPHPDDEVWSFFAGINLSSLFDLMGGR